AAEVVSNGSQAADQAQDQTMHRLIPLTLLALLASCTTPSRPAQTQSLAAPSYSLFMWSNCQEGEVGCSDLSGELVPANTTKAIRLKGSTYMVKCADGVTPCHVGFYTFSGKGYAVNAYPDGRLEVTPPAGAAISEQGAWL